MKTTSNSLIRPTLRGWVIVLAVLALSGSVARGVPYASCITNNAGTVSYYLNEAATNVNIIFDGGGPDNTNTLGITSKGLHSFSLAGHTTFQIEVKQVAPVGWTLISDDTNPYCEYASPRGVAVSQVATNLSTFGRIYVSDSLSGGIVTNIVNNLKRTNWGKGIFVLNADQSDALGQTTISTGTGIRVQALSNGMAFNMTSPTTSTAVQNRLRAG